MVLRYAEFQRAEDAILATIQASDGPLRPTMLIAGLKQQGISEDLARAAMWYLIDRNRIEITSEWLLARSSPQPTRPAPPAQQRAGGGGTAAG